MPTFTGTAGGETLNGTNDADIIYGLGGNDSLFGFAGNDLLDGGAGSDAMQGHEGNDHYVVDDIADTILESAGQGDDWVHAIVSYALAAGISIETMTTGNAAATTQINLTGNELGNSIYGNAGNNVLNGGGGADYLVGLGGNDRYIVDSFDDRIAESANDGDDWLLASTSYTLNAGVSVETISTTNEASSASIELSGNEAGQSIYGNAGGNVLRGNGGNDFLVGMAGEDYLFGGDGNDVIIGGAGPDRIETGPGEDLIIYQSVPETVNDSIGDWEAYDRIDLSAIDANALLEGNQAFVFAGYSFGHPPTNTAAGTLTIAGFGGELYIIAYIDGDGVADLVLSLWSSGGESELEVYNLIL